MGRGERESQQICEGWSCTFSVCCKRKPSLHLKQQPGRVASGLWSFSDLYMDRHDGSLFFRAVLSAMDIRQKK